MCLYCILVTILLVFEQNLYKMTSNNLSVERELRYVIQWFNEWSELQRDDFLPILSEYLTNENGVYMNGLVSGLAAASCLDKPMSLFQCRVSTNFVRQMRVNVKKKITFALKVKLFREWSAKWPMDLKLKLKEKVLEIDPAYFERLNGELVGAINGNGEIASEDHLINGNNIDALNPLELAVLEQPQQLLLVSEG